MRVALDSSGNRIYASNPVRYMDCFCPVCGEALKHKIGKRVSNYFSHMPDSECAYGKDKDSKCEWHIRMQDYFPKEMQEVRFVDEKTNEVHIADVYIEESKTVLEFQHSPIDPEEFDRRTSFHLSEGRRVVWLFDESTDSEDAKRCGRFKRAILGYEINNHEINQLYSSRYYRWLRSPRSFVLDYMIRNNLELNSENFSVCVYTGKEENETFHKLVDYHIGFDYVYFSLHDIVMNSDLNVDEFFIPEDRWLEEEPWKTRLKEIERKSHLPREIADRDVLSIFELWKPYEYQMIAYNTEENKCYLVREDKRNKGKMMCNFSGTIQCQYVDWNWLRGKIKSIYPKFYPLNNFKASKKIWILVRGYGKNGINR